MKQHFELVKFKLKKPLISVVNTAPTISNFKEHVKVFANSRQTVDIADVTDAENSDTLAINSASAECNDGLHDWINLPEPTLGIKQISIVLTVAEDAQDDECTVTLTISDNDPKSPISITKNVKISVFA